MSELKSFTTIEELKESVRRYHAEEPLGLVDRAWAFAEAAHSQQVRKSGEPYFSHPRTVATILADLMLDPTTIAAGLLHDCVEDIEGITVETIRKEFGQEVAQLVDGVTKLTRLDGVSREEQQAETLRKMMLAMSKDIRVVLIKLADRLHNMKTLKFQPPERQIAIAQETLDIYAPLAHRLGVFTIKQELEDLALLYIDPDEYRDLSQRIGMKREERSAFIKSVIDQLRAALDDADIPCDITGRPKHFYSIYKKMVIQGRPFEQIYDLTAVRILVENVSACYAALGIVHTLWRQLPNRFKDYISNPKPNLYQSIHTTVIGGDGKPFEVQIRTYEMHKISEYGIAAHWRYKEGRQVGNDLDKKLYWLRNILDWQNETKDPKEFIDSLKVDMFSDEVFVFTPKGAIIDLPKGATPLDFAYRIHSQIGNRCTGAKVNGRIVPLSSELATGDFVEILTSSASRGPSRDWLKTVKTSQAKAKIRQYFKKQYKEENIELGRTMLEHESQRQAADISVLMKPELVEVVLRKYSFQGIDDLYVAVGCGLVSAMHTIARLMEELKKRERPAPPPVEPATQEQIAVQNAQRQQQAANHGVFVDGDATMLVRFAHCCNPIPGDEIVGYITRGRGVTVHKADCTNALNVEHERMIPVSWDAQTDTSYLANVQIVATDHENLVGEIIAHLNLMKIPQLSINAKVHENGTTKISLTLKISARAQLDKLIHGLKQRSDVIEACRVGQ